MLFITYLNAFVTYVWNIAERHGPDFLLLVVLFFLSYVRYFFAGLPASPLVPNASVSMREEAGKEQVGGRQ